MNYIIIEMQTSGDALNTSFGWWYANGTGNYPVFESVKLKLGRL